ncbi:MAG: YopX family protein [Oscillospiraceae bacterium]|nr:YopX family protein [Oscillospiraceae bacterium]
MVHDAKTLSRALTAVMSASVGVENYYGSYVGIASRERGEILVYEVDPNTLGECAGAPDKNGKPIFEGDIVQTKHGRLCKVVRRINSAVNCWGLVPLECKHRSPDEWDLWNSNNLLVVGNVHNNLKLLEGGEYDER